MKFKSQSNRTRRPNNGYRLCGVAAFCCRSMAGRIRENASRRFRAPGIAMKYLLDSNAWIAAFRGRSDSLVQERSSTSPLKIFRFSLMTSSIGAAKWFQGEPLDIDGSHDETVCSVTHGHVAVVLGTLHKLGLDRIISSKPVRYGATLIMARIVSRIIFPGSKLVSTVSIGLHPFVVKGPGNGSNRKPFLQ